ncbi:hypothetical protein SAMN05421874_110149 [Nonomuraea maritima]|uniref:Uncharacterized protein n=1 Tax=Nonomuraea maritima TaxID=683260 RepID=A0A1G9E6H6_9ACTN|nr:hypothetical protein [Nonomuraea maritima]SDK71729.1 hypothetical protein SAMN05421874_110149 [Nonomuraea maritima]
MTDHRCDLPDLAREAEPWRCPECGMRWELLPASQDTKLRGRRALDKQSMTVIAAIAGVLVGGGALNWAVAVLRAKAVSVGMVGFVALTVAAAYWQNARSRR